MPTSSSKRGFTLIEVLVVVLIIGLSLSVLFRLDYAPGPGQVGSAAHVFAGSAELMLEEAVLSGDDWGIDFFRERGEEGPVYGYRWLHFSDGRWREDIPAGLADFPVATVLDDALSLQLVIDGLAADIDARVPLAETDAVPADFAPDIGLYPDHESTPFAVVFTHPDYAGVTVASDMLGRIRVREPQP